MIPVGINAGCHDRVPLEAGQGCELNSDCASPLVCRLDRCREECASARDCRPGFDCVTDTSGFGSCQVAGDACSLTSDCPRSLVCRAGLCTNACETDRDCASGATCLEADGVLGCVTPSNVECVYHSECPTGYVCGVDRRCREQCHADKDCRDGRVCDRGTWPWVCAFPFDAGTTDAGADAGPMDAGRDTGPMDAGRDAGSMDAGFDTGPMDAGRDAGSMDAGFDTGPMDAGRDTGPADAGAPDGGLPVPPPLLLSSGDHTCAVAGTEMRCWGVNADGQVGDGTMTSPVPTPTPVMGLPVVPSGISAGSGHTCAMSDRLRCWGNNDNGELGDGTMTTRLTPVPAGSLGPVRSTAASGNHTCAVVETGAVYCWGNNAAGQLGDSTMMSRLVPTAVVGLGGSAVMVAARGQHTCALMVGGTVRCWGQNGNGQLGNNSTSPSAVPVTVCADVACTGPLGDVIDLAVGSTHSCAVIADGTVKCWGSDGFLQLAGASGGAQSLVAVLAPGIGAARRISAGLQHTCVVTTAGEVWCWGKNTSSECSGPSSGSGVLPRRVHMTLRFDGIAAGDAHTCGRESGTGAIYCWGDNASGQCGTGSVGPDLSMPTRTPWP